MITAFVGYTSPFSNFYPALFEFGTFLGVEKHQAVSVEHAYVYAKIQCLKPEKLKDLDYIIKHSQVIQKFLADPDNFDVNQNPEWNTAMKDIKALGRSFKADKSRLKGWDQIKYSYMHGLVYSKFAQNPELQKILFETGDSLLVESAPWDSYWGIGLNRDEVLKLSEQEILERTGLKLVDRQFQESNRLGKILMKIRELIV